MDRWGYEKFPQQQCSTLRINDFVMMSGEPCKIVEMSTTETKKKGRAEVHLVALDIFTGKKHEETRPSTWNMYIPEVKRIDYQLVDIDFSNGSLTLIEEEGKTDGFPHTFLLPRGDIGREILTKFHEKKPEERMKVTVLSLKDKEQVAGIPNQ